LPPTLNRSRIQPRSQPQNPLQIQLGQISRTRSAAQAAKTFSPKQASPISSQVQDPRRKNLFYLIIHSLPEDMNCHRHRTKVHRRAMSHYLSPLIVSNHDHSFQPGQHWSPPTPMATRGWQHHRNPQPQNPGCQ